MSTVLVLWGTVWVSSAIVVFSGVFGILGAAALLWFALLPWACR